MKKLVVLLMAVLVATSAFAIEDLDVNSAGLYFDMNADTYCVEGAAPYSQHIMYMVFTNLDRDMLHGFEFGYDIVGSGMVLSTVFANPQALDVGGAGNHIVGFGSPTTIEPVTLLATMTVLYTDTTGAPFALIAHGSNPSSADAAYPVALFANAEIINTGMSTVEGPSIQINGACDVVATENVSFDSIKSLYR